MKAFWSKVVRWQGSCWDWSGSKHHQGYGLLHVRGKTVKAHRVSYRIHNGAIPAGMCVLHACDNTSCVNPEHLFLGTQADNVADMVAKGRARTKPRYGEDNPMARLNWRTVRKIRKLAAAGVKQIELSRRFGASPMAVSRVVRNLSWKEA